MSVGVYSNLYHCDFIIWKFPEKIILGHAVIRDSTRAAGCATRTVES